MDIKEAEAILNKGLAEAGKVYVDTINVIENEFHASHDTANASYRELMARNRQSYDADLLNAETLFNEANKKADDIYREAPVKAQSDYDNSKRQARADYETTKNKLHNQYQDTISLKGLGPADLRRS